MMETLTEARALEETVTQERRQEIHRLWKAKLTCNGKTASKRAFAASKLPDDWTPQQCQDDTPLPGGKTITADPVKLLQSERAKYKKLWKATD